MAYRGCHRNVPQRDGHRRRAAEVAAVVVSSLLALPAFEAPTAARADESAATLADRPEWRLSGDDEAVAAELTRLAQTLDERGVTYDPARLAAYRVPTVDGFTTYLTAKPETMDVRPNVALLEQTPDGVRAVSAADVLLRLLATGTQAQSVSADLGIVVHTTIVSDALDLAGNVADDLGALVDHARLVVAEHVGDPAQLIAELRSTITDWSRDLRQQVTDLLDQALATLDELDPAGEVFNIVPLAGAAPPDVVDAVVTNPNLPEGTREEHDGSGAAWTPRSSDCFRVQTQYFERRVCWRIDGQSRDSNPDKSYWQLHAEVIGHSIRRNMSKLWVEAKPSPQGASNQSFDAIPVPHADYGGSENCVTGGVQVSIASGAPTQAGLSFYWERTSCERYSPKTYDDDGHWASIWRGNDVVSPGTHRHVMLTLPVKTPYDKGVCWELLTGQWTTYHS